MAKNMMCGALPPTLLNTDIQKLLCAGTLPAKIVPKNIEIQAERCAFVFLSFVVKSGMNTPSKFRPKNVFF